VTPGETRQDRSAIRRLQALGDPVRVAIMRSLSLRPGSASDLAAEHDLAVEKVRYQLRRLKSEGLIRVHGQRQTRGTVELTYLADPRRAVSRESEVVAEATGSRRRFQEPLVLNTFREIVDALQTGVFRDNPGDAIARVPLKLDSLGYLEIQRVMDRAMERLVGLREESLRRLERSGGAPLMVVAALFHIEEAGADRGRSELSSFGLEMSAETP
jgi:DNA-binding transcriptional ArsR family regulator